MLADPLAILNSHSYGKLGLSTTEGSALASARPDLRTDHLRRFLPALMLVSVTSSCVPSKVAYESKGVFC